MGFESVGKKNGPQKNGPQKMGHRKMLLSAIVLAATYMPTCLVISNRLFAHHRESIQMDIKPFPSLKNTVTHITHRSVLSTSFS